MDRAGPALAAVVWCGALAGCGSSGLSVEHDYSPGVDFGAYRTYAWSTDAGDLSRNMAIDAPTDALIRASVDESLSRAGFTRVALDAEPQLSVGYIVTVTAQVVRPVGAEVDRSGGVYDSSPTDRWFEEGTLEVGLVDLVLQDVVWKGLARSDMGAVAASADRSDRVRRVVREIFKGFPPA